MYKIHCSWYYVGLITGYSLKHLIIKDIPNKIITQMPAESANNTFFNISMSIQTVPSTTWQTEERF